MNACGVDFGTSNSGVSIPDGESVRLVEVEGEATSIPSAVFFALEETLKPFLDMLHKGWGEYWQIVFGPLLVIIALSASLRRIRDVALAALVITSDEYAKARLPMLPVTHGVRYTQVMIVLYTVALVGVTLMPYALRMSGLVYLVAAIVLGAMFLRYAVRLYVAYSDHLARAMFRFSIVYLAALFSALLLDHFLQRAF